MKSQYEESMHLPVCTCGTCLKSRLTQSNFTKFPYSKNLGTTYKNEFVWKEKENSKSVTYYKSKHSGFDDNYKEHLTSGLISTQKFDYKPFKIELDNIKQENHLVQSLPFFGRSTYECAFPSWGSSMPGNQNKSEHCNINIPLRGKSNYSENYIQFDEKSYRPHTQAGYNKGTLDFFGKFSDYTTSRYNHRPITENEKKYFQNRQKFKKNEIERSSLIPAAVAKSNFETTYSINFTNRKNNQKCALAEFKKLNNLK